MSHHVCKRSLLSLSMPLKQALVHAVTFIYLLAVLKILLPKKSQEIILYIQHAQLAA